MVVNVTHLHLFKSQVESGGQSSALERLSEGREDAEQLSSVLLRSSSPHPSIASFYFSALKSLTCLPLFPPSLPPSSSHPISLPHSPFSPLSILRSCLPFSFLLPSPPSSPTFPLTSLPFSLSSPPFLSLPPLASPPSFHKMRLVVGW